MAEQVRQDDAHVVGDRLRDGDRRVDAERDGSQGPPNEGPKTDEVPNMPHQRRAAANQRAEDMHLDAVRVNDVRSEGATEAPQPVRVGGDRPGRTQQATIEQRRGATPVASPRAVASCRHGAERQNEHLHPQTPCFVDERALACGDQAQLDVAPARLLD